MIFHAVVSLRFTHAKVLLSGVIFTSASCCFAPHPGASGRVLRPSRQKSPRPASFRPLGRCPESEPRTKSCCSASLNVPGHWPARCHPARQRERESDAHRGNGSGATSRGCGAKVGPIPSRLRANPEESAPETCFLVRAPAPREGTAESLTRRTILGKEASGRGSFGRGARTKLGNLDVRATRAPHRPRSFPGRRAPSAGKSQIE